MKKSTGCPSDADSIDRRNEPNDVGCADGGFWDKATVHEIDAMQRKRSSAGLQGRLYVCRAGMAAPPSEAESRRSSSLGQAATSPMIWLFTTRLTQHPITRHCLILRSRVGRVHPRRRIWGRLDHRERGVICTPKLNVVGWKTPAPVIKFILSANASLPARRAIRAHQASATVARRNGVGIHPRRRPDESH